MAWGNANTTDNQNIVKTSTLGVPGGVATLNENGKLNEMPNIADVGGSNENLLHNWYFADPIDQRGGYVVPPGVEYRVGDWSGTSGITDKYYQVVSWKQFANLNPIILVDGVECVVASRHAVRGYTGIGDSVGYAIDRWRLTGSSNTVLRVDGNHITYGAEGNDNFIQLIEGNFAGKTITFSILCENPSNIYMIIRNTSWIPFNSISVPSSGIVSVTADIPSDYTDNVMLTICAGTDGESVPHSIDLYAAKLELGDNQTLAHQDANGNWVLNDPPPDRASELAKCQRFFFKFTNAFAFGHFTSSQKHFNFGISGTPTMRTLPSIVVSDVSWIRGNGTGVNSPSNYSAAEYVYNSVEPYPYTFVLHFDKSTDIPNLQSCEACLSGYLSADL